MGCDFFRDNTGTLCFSPKNCTGKMIDRYVTIFGINPNNNISLPLEKSDHTDTDDSELLDGEGISKCLSLVESLQWAIFIRCTDIQTSLMTLSSFSVAPRDR